MSREMIERVTKAIALNQGSRDWEECKKWPISRMYLSISRVAIEAMREPTDAMINAGVSAWLDENTPSLGIEAVIRLIFEAMMNEARK